jgi:hypothetical protein
MTNNYDNDMTFDVPWAETQEQRAGQIPPEVGEQEFEITKVTQGIQKQGENLEERYVNLLCTQMSGEFPGTRSTFKFIGFGTKVGKRGTSQFGETKAFIADIGRSDLFKNPDGSDRKDFRPAELLNTVFIADVAHSLNRKTGQTAIWLNQPRKSLQYSDEQYGAAQGATQYGDQPVIDAGFTDLPTPVSRPVATPVHAQAAAPQAPAPAVEPRPAIPRRMRPTPQG